MVICINLNWFIMGSIDRVAFEFRTMVWNLLLNAAILLVSCAWYNNGGSRMVILLKSSLF
jgi:hypothetical protein